MKTVHKVVFGDSREMTQIPSGSVDLVVTSPPYPMIKMWDAVFSKQNPAIAGALGDGEGDRAFELMHCELDKVWREVYRVLKDGGLACINVGDATRAVGGAFKLYANHARVLQCCLQLGFSCLPEILWRKQTNAPNKFMGSGVLPAGAYVTLEHEYILVLRKGSRRQFRSEAEKLRRLRSAFFWEERNLWFSDVWEDLKGTRQTHVDKNMRERSGAYPFELAYRLINMFSVKEDVVLDPFLGTGTTTVASMAAARNSVGVEFDSAFKEHIHSRSKNVVALANQLIERRLLRHVSFVQKRANAKGALGYVNRFYGFPVVTSQETELVFDELKSVNAVGDCAFEVEYKEKPTWLFKDNLLPNKEKA
ncbi:MAG: DNA-methyltransferase [Candidatus Bathyarchaeia archaeon]|jgi:DNA modification methylase